MTALLAASYDVPTNIAFGIVAVGTILAALRVVTTKNVMHAALYLVVVLTGVGVNFLFLQAEFVAITQLLVYVGAIVVLFVFGLMLTRAPLGKVGDLDIAKMRAPGLIASVGLLGVISYALISTFRDTRITLPDGASQATQAVSDSIFSTYLLPFEVVSVLLLAALIGAIVLARRD
jgi:NADH-quinone oxidoreductase subunit J